MVSSPAKRRRINSRARCAKSGAGWVTAAPALVVASVAANARPKHCGEYRQLVPIEPTEQSNQPRSALEFSRFGC